MIKSMMLASVVAGSILTGWLVDRPALPVRPTTDFELERLLEHRLVGFMYAPGDTLTYIARWPRWRGATGYKYSIRASGSDWTLPIDITTTDTFVTFKLSHLTAWDSVTFRLVVKGFNSFITSKDSAHVSWRVFRPLVPPGPPVIDSSQVVLAVVLKPENVAVHPGDQVQFCVFFLMLNQKYYIANELPENMVECRHQYDLLPTEGQLPGYPSAMIAVNSAYKHLRIAINAIGESSISVVM